MSRVKEGAAGLTRVASRFLPLLLVAVTLGVGLVPTLKGTSGNGVGSLLIVSVDGPTTGPVNAPLSFIANASGGTQPYAYSWTCDYNPIFPFFAAGSQTTTCTYSIAGVYDVKVHVTDSSGNGTYAESSDYFVTIGGLPTPTPTPIGGSLSVSLLGPSSGAKGTPLTYTASASGGSGSYGYSWWCDYSPFVAPVGGAQTQTCTYSSEGTYIVKVRVVDTVTGASVLSPDYAVTITGGLPAPSSEYSLSGPTVNLNPFTGAYEASSGSPITFTAAEAETNVASYTWNFGDGSSGSGRSVTHTYGSARSYTTILTVVGNETTTSGTASTSKGIMITGLPAPSVAYTVAGATQTGANAYEAEAGDTVTFAALETKASTYLWDFGDGTAALGKSVAKYWSTAGSRTVTLVVVGDGIDTSGSSSASISVSVIPGGFKAVIVPGAAHLDLGASVWGTDVTITNPGRDALTITPNFYPYLDGTPDNLDLSQIPYDSKLSFQLAPGASWSQVDVVKFLHAGSNKGTLIFKYKGTADPVVTARVYFASASDPLGGSYGAKFPSYKISEQNLEESLPADQTIIGLRSNDSYRFVVTLYNAASTRATFRLNAVDEAGVQVQIKDVSGSPVPNRDLTIGPYQQIQVSDSNLVFRPGNYVFKASRAGTAGALIAFGTALDRKTSDLVQISDDTPSTVADGAGNISYYVSGVSHLDTPRAQWRTDLRIFNRSSLARNLSFEYFFTKPGTTEKKALVIDGKRIGPGELITYDDVVDSLLKPGDPTVDLSGDLAGVLRIFYPEDPESATKPLIIGLRNYDDPSDGTGTAGTQLGVYSAGQSTTVGSPALVMPGAEDSSRFYSVIGLFALDNVLTTGRITAYDKAGNEVGHYGFAFNQTDAGGAGHFGQVFLRALNDWANPETPVTIRVTVTGGGRVGAFAVLVDLKTNDLTFIQGRPVP